MPEQIKGRTSFAQCHHHYLVRNASTWRRPLYNILGGDRLIDALSVCKTMEFPLEAEICEVGLIRNPPRQDVVSFALPRSH
jgi:hypothetical protein